MYNAIEEGSVENDTCCFFHFYFPSHLLQLISLRDCWFTLDLRHLLYLAFHPVFYIEKEGLLEHFKILILTFQFGVFWTCLLVIELWQWRQMTSTPNRSFFYKFRYDWYLSPSCNQIKPRNETQDDYYYWNDRKHKVQI